MYYTGIVLNSASGIGFREMREMRFGKNNLAEKWDWYHPHPLLGPSYTNNFRDLLGIFLCLLVLRKYGKPEEKKFKRLSTAECINNPRRLPN